MGVAECAACLQTRKRAKLGCVVFVFAQLALFAWTKRIDRWQANNLQRIANEDVWWIGCKEKVAYYNFAHQLLTCLPHAPNSLSQQASNQLLSVSSILEGTEAGCEEFEGIGGFSLLFQSCGEMKVSLKLFSTSMLAAMACSFDDLIEKRSTVLRVGFNFLGLLSSVNSSLKMAGLYFRDAKFEALTMMISIEPSNAICWTQAGISMFIDDRDVSRRSLETSYRLISGKGLHVEAWVLAYLSAIHCRANANSCFGLGSHAGYRKYPKTYVNLVGDATFPPQRQFLCPEESAQREYRILYEPFATQPSPDSKSFYFWIRKVINLQFKKPTTEQRYLLLSFPRQGFGLGATIHFLSLALSYGLRTDRRVVIECSPSSQFWYASEPGKDIACFHDIFELIGRELDASTKEKIAKDAVPMSFVRFTSSTGKRRHIDVNNDGVTVLHVVIDLNSPINVESVRKVSFWERSALSAFIFRIRRHYASAVEVILSSLSWPVTRTNIGVEFGLDHAPIYAWQTSILQPSGVHVRRQDKRVESPLFSVDTYFRCVPKNTKAVFVASDDASVVNEEATLGFKTFMRASEREDLSAATSAGIKVTPQNMTAHLVGVLSDIVGLSSCDVFIGTLSSNLGRLAFELQSAWNVAFSAPSFAYSLDTLWHNYP
mmetsp:Transcript_30275/g.78310  ORF Transcript_30275/g.78310 Transcript_30275/m.78310 type:complete len:657 (+) Transcript_30275:153-2123(+)